MNPPLLKIKKGSVVYDDSGAQQEAEPFRPDLTPAPGRRPVRRRPVGPSASLFPLLIIAAALFIFFRVMPRGQASRAELAGWQVSLQVTPYQDTLIVGLTFVSRSAQAQGAASEASAQVVLAGTAEQALISGSLVKSPMTLSGRLENLPGGTRVRAEVVIDGSRVYLSAPVPRPTPVR